MMLNKPKKSTREAYGEALVKLAEEIQDIVVLDADLSKSTMTAMFAKAHPDRFFNVGIAEQNLMAVAGGLAAAGKTVFASTFAVFATGRAYDQVRQNIAYNVANVKIAATHSGLTVGEDGASHQALEDISLMRSLPNMTVVVPADAVETEQAVRAAALDPRPYYIRLGRPAVPIVFDDKYRFQVGKAVTVREGRDVVIFATGYMLSISLEAAKLLEEAGVSAEVVNVSTIKPIDREKIVECARKCGRVVTAEEHSVIGGLGSAVCEVLSEEYPVRVIRIGVQDKFGESGTPDELMRAYGLSAQHVAEAACRAVSQK